MNLSARFTEFALTGAFFWIGQLIFFGFGYDRELMEILPRWMGVYYGYEVLLPEAIKGASSTMLSAFGLIGIFMTGLIMDMFSEYFTPFERIIFNRHIYRNQDWLNNATKDCSPTVHHDYQQLIEYFGYDYFPPISKSIKRIRLGRECQRIQAFLFSYIHAFSANAASELLLDHLHHWRTSRSVSTVLIILGIESMYFNFFPGSPWWAIALGCVFIIFSLSLTLKSYSRMCFSLFTLACATQGKHGQTTQQ